MSAFETWFHPTVWDREGMATMPTGIPREEQKASGLRIYSSKAEHGRAERRVKDTGFVI